MSPAKSITRAIQRSTGAGSGTALAVRYLVKSRDDITAEMLRWSERFIEQPDPIFGGLPICPFAKAARLNKRIRFEVLSFDETDPFEPDGRVMTLIEEFLGEGRLESLFVIHPEPSHIGARALEMWVGRLNARLLGSAATSDLQVFEAHPDSEFCVGGIYTRRSPYPSFQLLRRSLLKDASDSLLGSTYYDHFTPAMLDAVGMPRCSGNIYPVGAPCRRKDRR